MRTLLMNLAAAASFWPLPCGAQQPALQVIIEELSPHAVPCGLDRASLESTAALALRKGGIAVANASTNPHLYIRLMTLDIRNAAQALIGCINHVSADVRQAGPAPAGRYKPKGWVYTSLCQSTLLFNSSVPSFAKETSEVLEEQIKLCLGRLDY